MGEGVKLVPKRKLIGPNGGDNDVLISHILSNPTNIIPQIQGSWTIASDSPTLNFTETDQTDPDGRFRIRGTGKGLVIQRALTANWATNLPFLTVDVANAYIEIAGPAASNLGSVRLYGGATATTIAYLLVGASTTAAIDMKTSNGSGSNITRFQIGAGASSVTIDVNDADLRFSTGAAIRSSATNGDTLVFRANDTTFITLTTGVTDACTLASCTLSGTWLASGTVTFPAITFNDKITSTVGAGSPILKAAATSDTPTATWGAAAGNEVSTAPSGWLEMQDSSDNIRYIPFWA